MVRVARARSRGREPLLLLVLERDAPRQDVGQLLDVGTGDDQLAGLVLLAQPVDELSAKDVDPAVEDATLVGDFHLLFGELLDEILQLLVAQRAKIGKSLFHSCLPPAQDEMDDWASASISVIPGGSS